MADGTKPKGPLGAAKPAQGLRGPTGLAAGEAAAVGISGPIDRLGQDPGVRFGPAVVATASAIAAALAR